MCLSTVYRNSLERANIMMKNVTKIECREGKVILTDLMDDQIIIEGTLEMANLVDGVCVVRESA